MEVAVVVPCTGRVILTRMFEAIAHAQTPRVRVFAYVNGSIEKSSLAHYVDEIPGIDLVIRSAGSGYSRSRNAGIADLRSEGFDLAIFFDEDVIPEPGAIDALLTAYSELPATSIVSGWNFRYSVGSSPLYLAMTRNESNAPTDETPNCLPAGVIALPLQQLPEGSEFPDALNFTGGEDTVFTWWLKDNGFTLKWVADAKVVEHDSGDSVSNQKWLFRRMASSSVLQLRRHVPGEPWLWEAKRVPSSYLMTVVRLGTVTISKVLPMLSLQIARCTGALLGRLSFAPALDDGKWVLMRITAPESLSQ